MIASQYIVAQPVDLHRVSYLVLGRDTYTQKKKQKWAWASSPLLKQSMRREVHAISTRPKVDDCRPTFQQFLSHLTSAPYYPPPTHTLPLHATSLYINFFFFAFVDIRGLDNTRPVKLLPESNSSVILFDPSAPWIDYTYGLYQRNRRI